MENEKKQKAVKMYMYTFTKYMKFIIPSLLGLLLFVLPISYKGNITIPIAILTNEVQIVTKKYIAEIIMGLISISFFGSSLIRMIRMCSGKENRFFKLLEKYHILSLFDVNLIWFLLRAFSFLVAIFVYTQKGIKLFYAAETGTFVFYDLLPILFAVFLFAGLFLPLLLDFGLLEFTGTLLQKVMKPVFGLPGRSAIDAIASWLGDGSIGIILTSKQYEDKNYTEKEAAIIATNFSLVSITFSIVVINTVGLPQMFVPFYLTVIIACVIAAIILPKLPPLSRKKDLLIDGTKAEEEVIPKDMTGVSFGLSKALEKADKENVVNSIFRSGLLNVVDMWIAVIPIVLSVGTLALVLAEYTPVFKILGMPFLPLLYLLRIPDAVAASQTLFAGFADMLLPSVMIAHVESELTRFVVAAVSVSQLIYLSEVGALLIASKIPVKFKDLLFIFIERTLVTLPIIAVIAHFIF